jgi:hypothetical protein
MYFLFYFLIVILILLFIIIQFFNIVSQSTDKEYKLYLNILLFVVVLSTIIGVVINIYSIIKNNNKVGNMGYRGIEGEQGTQGKGGRCGLKCGQKVCYLNVVEYANEIFKKESQELEGLEEQSDQKIINKYFLDKINDLCNSDDYFAVLTKEHKNKPTEQKLINYIKDIISKWIVLIIQGNLETINNNDVVKTKENEGIFFLTSKNLKFEYLDSYNPKILQELKKYDIFNWGNPTIIKRKKYTIKSDTLKHPKPDEARLYIVKSNNYMPVYNANSKTDVWDVKKCPYNQLGVNLDNPNNLKKCIYINKNSYKKTYHNTWKTNEYFKPQELSLYIPIPFKNKNNQKFYPIGSVWRGQNSYEKPNHATNTPESSSFCGDGQGLDGTNQHMNKGPEKETILVSGDVVSPEKYELLWSSKKKCPECQTTHVQIFRPIAPKGYIALGDVAVKYNYSYESMSKQELKEALDDETQIKCVPEECVRKLKLGNKIWNNNEFSYNKYSNYLNYTSKIPYNTNKQLGVSLWDAGNSNSGEEIKNNYGVELVDNGGYNLFRTSKHTSLKPEMDAYILKQKYLMMGDGKSPKKISFNFDKIKDNNPNSDSRYNTTKYFGEKPPMAIISNNDENLESPNTLLNNINESKQYYLVDDNKKRNAYESGKIIDEARQKTAIVPDTYFIKTFNKEKNDFSSCLEYDSNFDTIKIKPYCSMNSKYNRWVIDYGDVGENVAKSAISIHPDLDQTKKLKNYYDENSNNINTLVENDSTYNWIYETPVADKLPQKKNSGS